MSYFFRVATASCVALLLLLKVDGFFIPQQHTQSPRNYVTQGKRSTISHSTDAQTIDKSTSLERTPSYTRQVSLLTKALTSFNSSDASQLIIELSALRSNGTDEETINSLLNQLLSDGPDGKLPFWTVFRSVAIFSNRGRLASLRRTLDLTTPPPNEEDDEPSADDRLRRRRRALISLLRQLATVPEERSSGWVPAIRIIEWKARREQLDDQSSEDLRSRLAQGLETPEYEILSQTNRDGVEIRRYKHFTVCSVTMGKSKPVSNDETKPSLGGPSAFNSLAGYLFGNNQQKTAMKMTTPVLMDGDDETKQMSFVLPSQYWEAERLSTAPQPMEGSGVTLATRETQERAVVMFGGYASKKEVERRKEQLVRGLESVEEWRAVDDEPVTLAQYNDPFTPPWKRLNEVSLVVQRTHSSSQQ